LFAEIQLNRPYRIETCAVCADPYAHLVQADIALPTTICNRQTSRIWGYGRKSRFLEL